MDSPRFVLRAGIDVLTAMSSLSSACRTPCSCRVNTVSRTWGTSTCPHMAFRDFLATTSTAPMMKDRIKGIPRHSLFRSADRESITSLSLTGLVLLETTFKRTRLGFSSTAQRPAAIRKWRENFGLQRTAAHGMHSMNMPQTLQQGKSSFSSIRFKLSLAFSPTYGRPFSSYGLCATEFGLSVASIRVPLSCFKFGAYTQHCGSIFLTVLV